jgi:hypothetical protein
MFEVHLWRADMLCGILEIEPSGKIVSTSGHKLNPPGAVLGCPNEALVSHHIGSILPLNGRVASLFHSTSTSGAYVCI